MSDRDLHPILLRAANLIEQGSYDFEETGIPESCEDTGCVLGWAAYAMGLSGIPLLSLDDIALELGFWDQRHFYDRMDSLCKAAHGPRNIGLWQEDAKVAADLLRYLADQEYAS